MFLVFFSQRNNQKTRSNFEYPEDLSLNTFVCFIALRHTMCTKRHEYTSVHYGLQTNLQYVFMYLIFQFHVQLNNKSINIVI